MTNTWVYPRAHHNIFTNATTNRNTTYWFVIYNSKATLVSTLLRVAIHFLKQRPCKTRTISHQFITLWQRRGRLILTDLDDEGQGTLYQNGVKILLPTYNREQAHCALTEPSGPWHLTFAHLGRLGYTRKPGLLRVRAGHAPPFFCQSTALQSKASVQNNPFAQGNLCHKTSKA